MALASEPVRGPRGERAGALKCGMPIKLLMEMLEAACDKGLQGKVVLDLCSGFQSLKQAVIAMGGKYVAVDVKDRGLSRGQVSAADGRAAAVVLQGPEGVLMEVSGENDDTHSFVKGVSSQDKTHYDAACEAFCDKIGISHAGSRPGGGDLSKLFGCGPMVVMVDSVTYFVFTPNHMSPTLEALISKGSKKGMRWKALSDDIRAESEDRRLAEALRRQR